METKKVKPHTRFQTSQLIILRHIFSVINNLIETVNLVWSEKGIMIRSMDSSNIALFILHLDAEAISDDTECKQHYTAVGSGVVGFTVKSLATLLKGIKGTLLEVYADEDGISLTFSDQGGRTGLYTISPMMIDSEDLEPSISKNYVWFTVDMDLWRDCIKAICLTGSDTVTITKKETNKLSLKAAGDFITGDTTIPVIDDNSGMALEEIAPATMDFKLGMLDALTKLDGVAEFMEFAIANDEPILGRVKLDCLGSFTVFLAPKVPEEMKC